MAYLRQNALNVVLLWTTDLQQIYLAFVNKAKGKEQMRNFKDFILLYVLYVLPCLCKCMNTCEVVCTHGSQRRKSGPRSRSYRWSLDTRLSPRYRDLDQATHDWASSDPSHQAVSPGQRGALGWALTACGRRVRAGLAPLLTFKMTSSYGVKVKA